MRIHTENEKHTVLSTMKEIEAKLPSNEFIRIQRSFIVRVDKILSIEDNYVVMKIKKFILERLTKKN